LLTHNEPNQERELLKRNWNEFEESGGEKMSPEEGGDSVVQEKTQDKGNKGNGECLGKKTRTCPKASCNAIKMFRERGGV